VVLIVYAGWGLIDIARLPQGVHLGLYLVMTVFALLALRVVLQAALLREEHEPGSGAPVRCPNCGQLVPDMAFCSNCGIATNASSRSSWTAPTPHRQPRFSFADSGLREVSPAADRRNDCVVSLEDKIVELSASDGAQKVKLVGGIGSGEDVQGQSPTVAPLRCGWWKPIP